MIGLGMGRHHAYGFRKRDDIELVGLAELNNELLQEMGKELEVEALFEDYSEMLEATKPDIVSVALPNFLHEKVAIDAMESGAHVLCEKPLAMSVEEGERMKEVAQRCGRQLGLNLSYRFSPAGQALKQLVDDGFIGEAYHGYTRWLRRDGFPRFGGWFGKRGQSGGGPLIDLGVHRIDLAMWLMGSPEPVSVSGAVHERIGRGRAAAEGKEFDVEDLASGMVKFENGASLLLEASWAGLQEKQEDMLTRVMGERGTLIHQNIGEGYEFEARFARSEAGQYLTGRVELNTHNASDPYQEMVACVKEGRPFPVDVDDGLRIQKVLDGLYQSAASGREVVFGNSSVAALEV